MSAERSDSLKFNIDALYLVSDFIFRLQFLSGDPTTPDSFKENANAMIIWASQFPEDELVGFQEDAQGNVTTYHISRLAFPIAPSPETNSDLSGNNTLQ